MSSDERVERFQRQVAECQAKADAARTEETRRAWLIAAREWSSMLERERMRYVAEPAATLIPSGANTRLEAGLKELAGKSRG